MQVVGDVDEVLLCCFGTDRVALLRTGHLNLALRQERQDQVPTLNLGHWTQDVHRVRTDRVHDEHLRIVGERLRRRRVALDVSLDESASASFDLVGPNGFISQRAAIEDFVVLIAPRLVDLRRLSGVLL